MRTVSVACSEEADDLWWHRTIMECDTRHIDRALGPPDSCFVGFPLFIVISAYRLQ